MIWIFKERPNGRSLFLGLSLVFRATNRYSLVVLGKNIILK